MNTTDETVFRHTLPVQLRFNDIDGLGHLNNSVYFSFYDLGKLHYFESIRPDMREIKEIDLVVANVNANFLAPIFLHDDVVVQTRTAAIGNKSIKLFQQIMTNQRIVNATCETVLVGFDFKTGTTKPISAEWRQAIEAYESRTFEKEK